jgi:hypothetical protein
MADDKEASFLVFRARIRGIFLSFWTSLDILVRYWMVGRVGIEPTTN